MRFNITGRIVNFGKTIPMETVLKPFRSKIKMTYKLRALMFALAAVVFVAPAAFAANFVGGADVEVPPGVSSVDIDIETDDLEAVLEELQRVA